MIGVRSSWLATWMKLDFSSLAWASAALAARSSSLLRSSSASNRWRSSMRSCRSTASRMIDCSSSGSHGLVM